MNAPAVIKYPLPCGCAGPKYISMCEAHKDEAITKHREMMGTIAQVEREKPNVIDEAIKIVQSMEIIMLDTPASYAAKKNAIEALKALK